MAIMERIVTGVPSEVTMDSLDIQPPAAPSATLSSLSHPTIPIPVKDAAAGHEVSPSAPKRHQPEHIYDQLIPNGHCKHAEEEEAEEKEEAEQPQKKTLPQKPKVIPDKIFLPDPLPPLPPPPPPPLRPLSPWSSAPDVRKSDRLNFNPRGPNNFGSLSENKRKPSGLHMKGSLFLEEDPSVFSISGRRVVVANGFKGGSEKKGDHSLPQRAPSPDKKVTNGHCNRRSSEDMGLIEMKRRRLQRFTDCFSLCLFVPSTILCVLSPWLLIPIYVIPNFMANHFQTLLWVCCIGSTLLVFVGCLVGNMVWYKRGGRWRCLLHCGRGPRGHYWGNSPPPRNNELHTV